MKKLFLAIAAFALGFALYSFTLVEKNPAIQPEAGIQWISWEQAVELNKTKPKKIVIDVYTDWCGWCKKMDREIFSDPAVGKYVAENYYAVKLDAEQKPDILFNNHTFKYIAQGNRGYHEFAASLLDNNMGYPTLVYLSEKYERTVISPGYKDVPTLMKELKFTGDNVYKSKSWDDYIQGK